MKIMGINAGRADGNSELLMKEALMAAEEACQQLPAFDKARPENQPDAE